jgi:hypothetical protein
LIGDWSSGEAKCHCESRFEMLDDCQAIDKREFHLLFGSGGARDSTTTPFIIPEMLSSLKQGHRAWSVLGQSLWHFFMPLNPV